MTESPPVNQPSKRNLLRTGCIIAGTIFCALAAVICGGVLFVVSQAKQLETSQNHLKQIGMALLSQ